MLRDVEKFLSVATSSSRPTHEFVDSLNDADKQGGGRGGH